MRRTAIIAALIIVSAVSADAQEAVVTQQPTVPMAIAPFADALLPGVPSRTGLEGRTYVPVYSSVMGADGRTRIDFSVTLSVHNGSALRPITIERIDYFDTSGKLVETPLDRPIALKPYGTIQIVVGQRDIRGGLGANFVVDWVAPTASVEPIVEAIMLSAYGNQSYAFATMGRKVER